MSGVPDPECAKAAVGDELPSTSERPSEAGTFFKRKNRANIRKRGESQDEQEVRKLLPSSSPLLRWPGCTVYSQALCHTHQLAMIIVFGTSCLTSHTESGTLWHNMCSCELEACGQRHQRTRNKARSLLRTVAMATMGTTIVCQCQGTPCIRWEALRTFLRTGWKLNIGHVGVGPAGR